MKLCNRNKINNNKMLWYGKVLKKGEVLFLSLYQYGQCLL